jgi:hypothetical protein
VSIAQQSNARHSDRIGLVTVPVNYTASLTGLVTVPVNYTSSRMPTIYNVCHYRASCYVTADIRCNDFTVKFPTPRCQSFRPQRCDVDLRDIWRPSVAVAIPQRSGKPQQSRALIHQEFKHSMQRVRPKMSIRFHQERIWGITQSVSNLNAYARL